MSFLGPLLTGQAAKRPVPGEGPITFDLEKANSEDRVGDMNPALP